MNRTFIAASIVALGVAATVPYIDAAQDQPQAQQAQGERMRRGHGPMGRGGRMGGPIAGGLGFPGIIRDLTDQQRDQVKAIREKHAERIRPLVERARTAREALNNAVISGNAANLQALSIEVGNAATELTYAEAQVQSEIYNVLTPEQKQKLAERRRQMEERRAERMKRRQERAK